MLFENIFKARKAQTVKDGAFSHKIDVVTQFCDILNRKGYKYCIIGSKFMEILLNRWISPICGVASERVCACSTLVYLGI